MVITLSPMVLVHVAYMSIEIGLKASQNGASCASVAETTNHWLEKIKVTAY